MYAEGVALAPTCILRAHRRRRVGGGPDATQGPDPRGSGPCDVASRRGDQLSTAACSPSMVRASTAAGVSARVTVILRARAFSATGMLRVSTPSW